MSKVRVALIRDQNTHKWILPKGRIEAGETLEDTSIRVVKEETGLLTAIEIANAQHAKLALEFDIDILWIGARTCPVASHRARGKVVISVIE